MEGVYNLHIHKGNDCSSYNEPPGILVRDKESDLQFYQEPFLTALSPIPSYLSVNPVSTYRYAFFSTLASLGNSQSTSIDGFTLLCNEDGTIKIKCNSGQPSFLATAPVTSWQYAFFATQNYLNKGTYIDRFRFIPTDNGNYQIQSPDGSYLAITPVNTYQWAFFGRLDYLDTVDCISTFRLSNKWSH